MQLLEVIGL